MRRALFSPGSWLLPLALWLAAGAPPGCGARTSLDPGSLDSVAVTCKTGLFTLQKAKPTLLLVIDRSRSMIVNSLASGRTRWEVLQAALASALPPVDETMAIGALLFPAPGVTSPSNANSCQVPGAPNLLPATAQVGRLLALLANNPPGGSTPTADAIATASESLRRIRAAGSARALVLATDGAPDCNESLDLDTCTCLVNATRCTRGRCLDDTRTVSRIAAAAAAGLPTYVIGIQDGATSPLSPVLDAMANAGQRPQANQAHRYYAATSEAELSAAFVTIRDQVGACTYLTSSVPNRQGTIRITLNGRELPLDPSGESGWMWTDQGNGELSLSAPDCAEANAASSQASAELTCEATGSAGGPGL